MVLFPVLEFLKNNSEYTRKNAQLNPVRYRPNIIDYTLTLRKHRKPLST